MKHSFKITTILLVAFLIAQFIGLGVIYNYIDHAQSAEEGKTVFKELPIGERPPLEEDTSYVAIIIAILIGTGLMLLLIKYKLMIIWKGWFLLAVIMALTVAFGAFIDVATALILAIILGAWKIFRPNFYVHTFTELFVYGGLAAIFVPLLNLLSVIILMILIAAYDAYAVWKSKHMVTLAKSMSESKVFAGLLIPYKLSKGKSTIHKKGKAKKTTRKVPTKIKTAILGGGDIGFPLIFAGVVLKEIGLWQSLIIPFFAALGLGYLLWKSEQGKFYPAMPFIGAGCFIGLGLIWLAKFLV